MKSFPNLHVSEAEINHRIGMRCAHAFTTGVLQTKRELPYIEQGGASVWANGHFAADACGGLTCNYNK